MSHKQWVDQIPFYITGALSENEKRSLEYHLQICESCHQALLEWTEIANVVHQVASEKSQLLPPLASNVREQVLRGQPTPQINLNGKFDSHSAQSQLNSESKPRILMPKFKQLNIPITLVASGILVLIFIGILIASVSRDSESPDDEIAFLAEGELTITPSPTLTVTSRGIEDIGIILSPTPYPPIATRIYQTASVPTPIVGVGGAGDAGLTEFGTNPLGNSCHIGADGTSITVYAFPTTSAEVTGMIDSGEVWLVIVQSGDGWYNVIDQETSERGWVLGVEGILTGICGDVPLPTPTASEVARPYDQCLASSYDENDSLEIYGMPSYESTLVYTMPPQTTATVLGYSDDEQWYQIHYELGTNSWGGWVNIDEVVLYFACDELNPFDDRSTPPTMMTPSPTLSIITPIPSTPHPQVIAFATSDDPITAGQVITVSWAVEDTTAIWLEYYDPENDPSSNSAYTAMGVYSDLPINGAIDVVIPQDYAYDTIYFHLILGTDDQNGRNAGEIIAVTVTRNGD